MSADLLALLASDPAAGILAVADLREQRTKAITEARWFTIGSEWVTAESDGCNCGSPRDVWPHEPYCGVEPVLKAGSDTDAEHIAAEASPAHALAEVRVWRVVGAECTVNPAYLSDPVVGLIMNAARAYLGGTP